MLGHPFVPKHLTECGSPFAHAATKDLCDRPTSTDPLRGSPICAYEARIQLGTKVSGVWDHHIPTVYIADDHTVQPLRELQRDEEAEARIETLLIGFAGDVLSREVSIRAATCAKPRSRNARLSESQTNFQSAHENVFWRSVLCLGRRPVGRRSSRSHSRAASAYTEYLSNTRVPLARVKFAGALFVSWSMRALLQ